MTTLEDSSRGDFIKIVFEPGETGWAQVVDPERGLASIENVPMREDLFPGDIVELARDAEDSLTIARIVEQSYDAKAPLFLAPAESERIPELLEALGAAGVRCEPLVPTLVSIAWLRDSCDPFAIARGLGIKDPEGAERE